MTRTERLDSLIADATPGALGSYNLDEWEEDRTTWTNDDLPRFARVTDSGYAWLEFYDTIEDASVMNGDGFEPVMMIDLDTGDCYMPVLSWVKS